MIDQLIFIALCGYHTIEETMHHAYQKMLTLKDTICSIGQQNTKDIDMMRNYIMRGNYEKCIQILDTKPDLPLTINDLKILATLQSLEENPEISKIGKNCYHVMQNYMLDHNLLPDDFIAKKGKLSIQDFIANVTGIQGQFFQAVRQNNIIEMQRLLSQGASVHEPLNQLSALDLAIAQSHQEALEFLIRNGARVQSSHLEQARLSMHLLQINQAEYVRVKASRIERPDFVFTEHPANAQEEGYREALLEASIIQSLIIRELDKNNAAASSYH